MIRVGVFGAAGRMGSTVCRAVENDPELHLVAAVDPEAAGRDIDDARTLNQPAIAIQAAQDVMKREGADVAVDFTVRQAAMENLRWCASEGVHAVVGTTGFTESDLAELRDLFASSSANTIIVPNFAIGAVLMMRFAEIASKHMDAAEIIELHHNRKVDAPSGTSIETARRMARAREGAEAGPYTRDATKNTVLEGARGASAPAGIRIHSVRLPGMVAHQEVVFGATGETLSIRHDSYDRESFMPGVLLAIKRVGELSGLTIGLEELLEF